MRIGMISDAHGNPYGLQACLDFLATERVDDLVFLGDCVGYMPGAEAVIAALVRSNARCIRGNHEEMLLRNLPLDPRRNEVYRLEETRAALSPEDLDHLAGWPLSIEMEVDGRRLLMVHGGPDDYVNQYVYADSDLSRFAGLPYDAVFFGQTHRPFVARSGRVLIANIGSCGMPRDQGDLASCAIYDSDGGECQIYRVPFDAARVLAEFGADVHPSVVECLGRTARNPIAGRIVKRSAA